MNPPDILQQHQQLCEEIHGCVLGENRFLRQYQRVPDQAMFEQKRALLKKLDASLDELRTLPAASVRDAATQAQLEKSRTRILQILQLDRENEQLLLRCSLAAPRPAGTPLAPNSALLQKIYARCK